MERLIFQNPRYEREFNKFFHDAIMKLGAAQDPTLSRIKSKKLRHKSSIGTQVEDVLIETPLKGISLEGLFKRNDIQSTNIEGLAASLDTAAKQIASQIVPAIYDLMDKVCDISGNVSNVKAQDLTLDNIVDLYDKLPLRFDNDGNLIPPELHINPIDAERLSKLIPTPEQNERLATIIERKRKEFNASKRNRKLS